jgi:hypothetical protein
VFTLDGQALRRDTRAAAAGLRVELWFADTLKDTAESDQAGRFTLSFLAPSTATAPAPAPPTTAPPGTLRLWETGRRLPDIDVPADAWVRRHATVFAEVGPRRRSRRYAGWPAG